MTLLKRQLDEVRASLTQARERQRRELDEVMREEHRRALEQVQERHQVQMRALEEEKKRLKEEMERTVEIERDKVCAQQRLEIEHKEM